MIHRMTIDEQVAYLTKGCVDVVRVNELRAKLERAGKTGQPLTVKVGFDPTGLDLAMLVVAIAWGWRAARTARRSDVHLIAG